MTPRRPRAPAAAPPSGREAHTLDRLRLRHLRLLDLIDRLGSLGGAARSLGVTQPAVTLMLRELEEVFGTVLVSRDARGARLTVAGSHARARLDIATASVARAAEDARDARAEPVLRLGTVQMAGIEAVPATIAALERAGSQVRLRLIEGRARDLVAALTSGELDGVIGWMDEPAPDALVTSTLAIQPLWSGQMQVAAAARHPLTRARSLAVEALAHWRWIAPRPASRTHDAFVRLFLHNGVPLPPVAFECSALHTTMRIVAATQCLAVAPDTVIRHYARQGGVTALKGAALDLGRSQVSFMTRRDSADLPAVREFRDALIGSLAP